MGAFSNEAGLGSASVDVVWDVADTFNGLMAIPNFISLFALSGIVAKLTKAYFSTPSLRT